MIQVGIYGDYRKVDICGYIGFCKDVTPRMENQVEKTWKLAWIVAPAIW